MKAAILDLRRRTRDILRAIEHGETVTILCRGKEKAIISPLPKGRGQARPVREHPAFGIWKDRADLRDVAGFVRGLRKARAHAV